MRANLEPCGFRAWDHRFPARRTRPDKQAQDGSAHELNRQRRARIGLHGAFDRSRNRVWREADYIIKKGDRAACGSIRHSFLTAHVTPYLRGMDGAGGCSNAENQPVSRAYISTHDRTGLRQVFPFIYARCGGRGDVLVYIGTQSHFADYGLNHLLRPVKIASKNRRISAKGSFVIGQAIKPTLPQNR